MLAGFGGDWLAEVGFEGVPGFWGVVGVLVGVTLLWPRDFEDKDFSSFTGGSGIRYLSFLSILDGFISASSQSPRNFMQLTQPSVSSLKICS